MHDLRGALPDLEVYGLDVSAYALENALWDARPYCVRGTADVLPYADDTFDLVISINTIHNLDLDRCKQALREVSRVSRKHAYVQVDSWLTEEQRENFERWQLTAMTYFDPRRLAQGIQRGRLRLGITTGQSRSESEPRHGWRPAVECAW